MLRAMLVFLGIAMASVAAGSDVEQRVAVLAEQLRCLVCQNQTLVDSNAPLAMDLKNQIREQLRAGRSEREVIAFMVARYGDFVLYKPPLRPSTALLWIGPFLLLAGALAGMAWFLRRRPAAADEAQPSP